MKRILPVILLSTMLHFSVHAGNENLPTGGRSVGIAHASVCLIDLWGTHHNQANLAYLQDIGVGVFYENRFLVQQMGLQGLSFALPTEKSGTFGLSFSRFGYSQYNESKYGISYARKFGENFSAGMQLNYLSTYIAENYGRNNAFSVEAGVRAKLTDELAIGFHAYNINRAKLSEFQDERIPTILRLGLQYDFSEKVFVSAEVEKDIAFKPVFKAGTEYHVGKAFYIRAGISTNPFFNTFGVGFEIAEKANLDLAAAVHPVLGTSPQVSFSYTFK